MNEPRPVRADPFRCSHLWRVAGTTRRHIEAYVHGGSWWVTAEPMLCERCGLTREREVSRSTLEAEAARGEFHVKLGG